MWLPPRGGGLLGGRPAVPWRCDVGSGFPQLTDHLSLAVDSDKRHARRLRTVEAARSPRSLSGAPPWGNGRPGWHIECSTIARPPTVLI